MKGQSHHPTPRGDLLMAMLGHELGNVLNGLLGMGQLVRDSGLNPEQEQWLQAMMESGRQMCRLVEAFRGHRRGPASPARPVSAVVDGVGLLEQAVRSHLPAAQRRDNQLLLVVDPRLPRYWKTDACLLRQVLDNLLGNAIKFTIAGRVTLEAAADRSGRYPGQELLLSVSDTGCGIRAHLGERLFEAGRQGPEGGHDGSGLGLFICRGIVTAMRGRIDWSSPAAGGTHFHVRLPLVPAAPEAGRQAGPRLLRRLHCNLDLQGALFRSVSGWLSRLGVDWVRRPAAAPPRGPGQLVVKISEADGSEPGGPQLLLEPQHPRTGTPAVRKLAPPVLESTLGPLLLQLALEFALSGNERPGCAPPPRRAGRQGDRGPRPA